MINYDCPASVTDYVHRVGRCGRYNRKGKALTLMTDKDQDRIRILRGVMTQAGLHEPFESSRRSSRMERLMSPGYRPERIYRKQF